MWKNLDHKKKNLVLIGAMLLLLYVAYVFSLKHTITAVQLNRQLKKEQDVAQTTDSSFPQINRKNNYYVNALKSYKVKKEDRENKLWQMVSNIAILQNVKIAFSPNQPLVADTTALQQGVVLQQFTFKGSYFNLVKLLDTLSKSKGIGKIAEAKLSDKKELDGKDKPDQLTLQLNLSAIAQ